jgi:hypothetical protein
MCGDSNLILADTIKEIYFIVNKSKYFTLNKNNELARGW